MITVKVKRSKSTLSFADAKIITIEGSRGLSTIFSVVVVVSLSFLPQYVQSIHRWTHAHRVYKGKASMYSMSHDCYFKYDKTWWLFEFQSRAVKSNRITIIFVFTFGAVHCKSYVIPMTRRRLPAVKESTRC